MVQADGKTLGALLGWYEAMGADEAIGDKPVDRFAAALETHEETRTTSPGAPAASRATSPATSGESPATPGSIEAAASLAELEALLAQFEGCALKRTAKSLCFARGSDNARLMLIGEAPGRDEDLQGLPFVGRAGKLLDRMLAAIGLDEASVYITNTIYWRPPGNRTPTPQEVEACRPFLERQIELLSPQVLVLLGGAAAKHILGVTEGIMRLRGKWKIHKAGGRDLPTLATLHPAYLLRNPEAKRYAWRDLLAVKARLEDIKP